jgi:phosphonate transport system ATP-binding protein
MRLALLLSTSSSVVEVSNDRLRATGGVHRSPFAIEVRQLAKRFASMEKPLFDGLELFVPHGEAVALIGSNGTGKSTLLRALNRLTEVDSGAITVLDKNVRLLDRRALRLLRARIGFVFQKHNLVTRLSALSNVIHGVQARMPGPRSWYQWAAPEAVRAEALHCLERVGLADRAMQRVDSLSGGQSQRVAIARMLMQRPELVIADEPDASLDPKAGIEIMELLYNLTREQGLTLLFVSHHMEHAIQFADRIIGLEEGRVAFDRASNTADAGLLKAFFDEKVAA